MKRVASLVTAIAIASPLGACCPTPPKATTPPVAQPEPPRPPPVDPEPPMPPPPAFPTQTA